MGGRTLTYTLRADTDNFESGFKRAKGTAKDLFSSIGQDASRLVNGRKLASAFKDIGQSMTAAFTLPITAAFGAVIVASQGFDREMTKSMAIMGNVSTDMRKKLEDNARNVAKTMGVSHEEAARSYYALSSAGLTAEQAISALPLVAQFAKAGMMEMSSATDLLTGAQTALGLSFKDPVKNATELARVSDVLVQANNFALGSTEEFAAALSNKSGAAMRQYGQTVEAGTAVLMAFAAQNVRGQVAGEQYAIAIRELGRAANENVAQFAKAKIAVFDSNGAMRNMADILANVEQRFAGMSTQQKIAQLEILGITAKTQGAILPLIGMSGAIRGYEVALKSAGGATKDVADKQLKSFSEQANLLKIAITDVAISLGQTLLPIAQRFVSFAKSDLLPMVSSTVEKFKELPAPVQNGTVMFVGLLAVLGPAIYVFGSVATVIGTVISAAKTLMATNLAVAIGGWVTSLAGGAGLIGVLGSAGGALSGFLATAVPWGVAAGAVFLGVYTAVKKLIDAFPGLRRAVDFEAANVIRWWDGKSQQDMLDPTKGNRLGAAGLKYVNRISDSGYLPAGPADQAAGAKALTTAAKEAVAAVNGLHDTIGKAPKKSFLSEYLEELRKVPNTVAEIATAIRQSIEQGLSRAGYEPLIATALGGMTSVMGKAPPPAWLNATPAPYGWNGAGSDYGPGIAALGDAGWYNHAGDQGYAPATKAAASFSQTLQNLSNVFNLATNATGKLGTAARTLASLAGGGAGIASGLESLKNGGFGSGLKGLLGKAGAVGSVVSSALSIGSAIWGLFKGKPKEPAPPPPQAVDAAAWKNFQGEQMSKGAAGLTAGVGGIQLTSAADLTSQATIAGLQFWSIFKTQGITAAASSVKAVIGKLVENLSQYGSEAATAVLAPIQQQIALAENDAFKGASEGAKGFADVLASQVNARMPMTIEQFSAFGQQAVAAFEQAKAGAIATGLETKEATIAALQAVGPLVTTAVDAASTYGFAIDANTQSLLDQAAANKVAFATDKTDRLILSIDALTTALGGVPPAVGAIGAAINNLPSEHTVNVHINQDGGVRLPGDLEVVPDNSFASGSGGLQDFGRGQLAMLHGREAVLTEDQYARLNDQATTRATPVAIHFGNITVHANDAEGGVSAAESFRDRLEDMLVGNTDGLREMMRRRLGLA